MGFRRCLPIKALSGDHPKVGSRNCLNVQSLSKLQGALYYQHILACNWCGLDLNNTRKVAVNLSQEGGITVKSIFYKGGPWINLFNYSITLISLRAKIIPIFSVDDMDNMDCKTVLICQSQQYTGFDIAVWNILSLILQMLGVSLYWNWYFLYGIIQHSIHHILHYTSRKTAWYSEGHWSDFNKYFQLIL